MTISNLALQRSKMTHDRHILQPVLVDPVGHMGCDCRLPPLVVVVVMHTGRCFRMDCWLWSGDHTDWQSVVAHMHYCLRMIVLVLVLVFVVCKDFQPAGCMDCSGHNQIDYCSSHRIAKKENHIVSNGTRPAS